MSRSAGFAVSSSPHGVLAEGRGGAESQGLGSQATFCSPPEETDMAAIIRSLAPPLQFTLISPKFPQGAQLPHELLLGTYN